MTSSDDESCPLDENSVNYEIQEIIILLLAVMLFATGMIIKETDERRQDISDFEKLEEIITETEPMESSDKVE